jgi:hypothetical protein
MDNDLHRKMLPCLKVITTSHQVTTIFSSKEIHLLSSQSHKHLLNLILTHTHIFTLNLVHNFSLTLTLTLIISPTLTLTCISLPDLAPALPAELYTSASMVPTSREHRTNNSTYDAYIGRVRGMVSSGVCQSSE